MRLKLDGLGWVEELSNLQAELRRIYRIWVSVVDLYAGNKTNARMFLSAPNRHLENRAPVEFIERGDLAPLEAFVEAMTIRQPASESCCIHSKNSYGCCSTVRLWLTRTMLAVN